MRTIPRKFALAAVSLTAAAALALSVGPASADPPSGTTPAATDLVSVGSDTSQVLDNALSAAFDAQSPAPASKYYSWDATPAGSITTKTGATSIARPNGSGGGITALNDVSASNPLTTGGVRKTVDLARSSRGPQGTATTDTFIQYAEDAIGWAGFTTTSTKTSDSPSALSYTDLQKIFNCTFTNWNQITDVTGYTGPNVTIKVVMPQANSGTRSTFLGDLGLASTFVGSCWSGTLVEENEGTDAALNDPAVIFPYSIGHYVGQVYDGKSSGTDAPGVLDALRSVINPPSGSGTVAQVNTTAKTINQTFANTGFGRFLWHVVLTSDWNGTGGAANEQAHLKVLLGKSGANGWICKNGGSIISSFGFLPLNALACGTTQTGT